ncbi:hypothetical protein [Niabella ginsengisoli]|nr:hypothetical protein [Niabella ginsengisoli]
MDNGQWTIDNSASANRELRIASIVPYKIVPAIKGGEKGIFLF